MPVSGPEPPEVSDPAVTRAGGLRVAAVGLVFLLIGVGTIAAYVRFRVRAVGGLLLFAPALFGLLLIIAGLNAALRRRGGNGS